MLFLRPIAAAKRASGDRGKGKMRLQVGQTVRERERESVKKRGKEERRRLKEERGGCVRQCAI